MAMSLLPHFGHERGFTVSSISSSALERSVLFSCASRKIHEGRRLLAAVPRCALCGLNADHDLQQLVGGANGQPTGVVVSVCNVCRAQHLVIANPARAKASRKRLAVPTLFDGKHEWLPRP